MVNVSGSRVWARLMPKIHAAARREFPYGRIRLIPASETGGNHARKTDTPARFMHLRGKYVHVQLDSR